MARKEVGNRGVYELSAIVGLHFNYMEIKLGTGLGDEIEKGVSGIGFVMERESPHTMRVIINNYEAIFLPTETCMRWRTKEVYMETNLQDPL